eukprot:6173239-Pleurochrysis_carterae.AAC.1
MSGFLVANLEPSFARYQRLEFRRQRASAVHVSTCLVLDVCRYCGFGPDTRLCATWTSSSRVKTAPATSETCQRCTQIRSA